MNNYLTPEEQEIVRQNAFPWPNVHEQGAWMHSNFIEWLPPHLVQSMCKDKFPDGCWIVQYRGGGLQTAFAPEQVDLMLRFIRATAGDYMGAWGIVAGRDISQPLHIVERTTGRQKSKAGVGYGKTKRHTPDLDLSELEDLFNSVDDSELSNDVMDLDQLLLDI